MKKSIPILLSLALLLGLAACGGGGSSAPAVSAPEEVSTPAETGGAEDGTYEGSAQGFGGELTVAVTLAGGAITDIQVTDHSETNGVSDQALENMPARIIENQSYEVDAISGATYTANGIKQAVKKALEEANAADAFSEKVAVTPQDETLSADVVIIGAGIAGLTAAIEAKEAGADVIVLEKLGRIGGSSVTAGGIFYATGSPLNEDEDNDPADMVAYYQQRANGLADPEKLQFMAEHSGESVAWLIEQGVEWRDSVSPTGTSPAPRGHYTAEGSGAGITQPLYNKVLDMGIDVLLETSATELQVDAEGAIGGVVATNATGGTTTISCTAVIMASGGFDTSEEMKAEYAPTAVGDGRMSSVGNVGDGIVMGTAIGADTLFRGGVIGLRTVNPALPISRGVNGLAWIPTLAVTDEGERFYNESSDYPISYTKMLETGRDTFFWIFDSSMAELAELAVSQNLAFKADSIEELAEAAGMDAATFAATVERYNELGEAGEDADFGREGIARLGDGPYYAVKVQRATIGSMGGLLVNLDTEVLNTDGEVIPGFYAIGEVANGDFFDVEYPASGTMLSFSTTFGRVAGQKAAEYAA